MVLWINCEKLSVDQCKTEKHLGNHRGKPIFLYAFLPSKEQRSQLQELQTTRPGKILATK